MPRHLALFALVAFATTAAPGPTVLLAFNNGANFGLSRACTGIWGAVLSDIVLIALCGLGLGTMLAGSDSWLSMVRWIGSAYLGWLGIRMLRQRESPHGANPGAAPPQATPACLRTFLVGISNPKAYLFFAALLPQFIVPSLPPWPQHTALACVFCAIDAAVMLAYAAAGAYVTDCLRAEHLRWLDRAGGSVLLLLALLLAFSRGA